MTPDAEMDHTILPPPVRPIASPLTPDRLRELIEALSCGQRFSDLEESILRAGYAGEMALQAWEENRPCGTRPRPIDDEYSPGIRDALSDCRAALVEADRLLSGVVDYLLRSREALSELAAPWPAPDAAALEVGRRRTERLRRRFLEGQRADNLYVLLPDDPSEEPPVEEWLKEAARASVRLIEVGEKRPEAVLYIAQIVDGLHERVCA